MKVFERVSFSLIVSSSSSCLPLFGSMRRFVATR